MAKEKAQKYSAVLIVQAAVRVPLNASSLKAAVEEVSNLTPANGIEVLPGCENIDWNVDVQAVEKQDLWLRY